MAYTLDSITEESVTLTIATDPDTGEEATADVPAAKNAAAKRLGIARRGSTLILVREHTVGKLVTGEDGKSKRDRKAGEEKAWKATALLVDFRDARRYGLVS